MEVDTELSFVVKGINESLAQLKSEVTPQS